MSAIEFHRSVPAAKVEYVEFDPLLFLLVVAVGLERLLLLCAVLGGRGVVLLGDLTVLFRCEQFGDFKSRDDIPTLVPQQAESTIVNRRERFSTRRAESDKKIRYVDFDSFYYHLDLHRHCAHLLK